MRLLFGLISLFFSINLYSYFDGGLNYTTGKDGYVGRDIYLLFGRNNWWIKPEYSSWESDFYSRIDKYSGKIGFENETYTLTFNSSYTPLKNKYKNVSFGSDITFSLNPTSSNRKRIAGPNSGFVSRSASGVTQIDIGAGGNLVFHTINDKDLKELNTSLFAGAKIFLTQLSINYTFYTYDDNTLAKTKTPLSQKIYGINSYFSYFLKSNFNFKVEIPGSPMVTPYLSYNRVKSETNEKMDIYSFGGYIDLNMLGVNVSFETYKGDITNDKRYNYLSVSGGIRF
jgi:hypothetical protein